MSRVLVVHHSRTGTCRMLAQALCDRHRWASGEVRPADRRDGYWRCALDALLRRAPPIHYDGPDPWSFDAVVLVSPVWCWRLSPPMRSFLRSVHGKLSAVGVVSTMGGSGARNAVAEVERAIHRPAVATLALRVSEVQAGEHERALQSFAGAVEANVVLHARPAQPRPATAAS